MLKTFTDAENSNKVHYLKRADAQYPYRVH